jgi:hypothetical protein
MRVSRRLSVAGKGENVRRWTLSLHLLQTSLQCLANLLACGELLSRTAVGIESALTIYAIEGAEFAVGRQQIDA